MGSIGRVVKSSDTKRDHRHLILVCWGSSARVSCPRIACSLPFPRDAVDLPARMRAACRILRSCACGNLRLGGAGLPDVVYF